MTASKLRGRISVIQGDITKLQVDAIVNAANNSLLGGGGVDGAIHRAAGPGLLEECRALGGCETGQAKITKGHNLLTRWVIHTVGPVWEGGSQNEDELLAGCYQNSLALARQYSLKCSLKSIAFPAISTGVFAFPLERATQIALTAVCKFLAEDTWLERVILVSFSDRAYQCYRSVVDELVPDS